MKLIYSGASPFVRKVSVVLQETGLLENTEMVEVTTTPVSSAKEAIAANPTGKIPSLILDDGSSIYDSRVICRYLNDKAGADLYPEQDIWRHLTLEATADAVMDAAVLMVYEYRVRPEENTYAPWVEAQWGKVVRAIKIINDDWMDVFAGPLVIGQIGVGCALNYLDFRHEGRDWRSDNPALADWFEEFRQRPSMMATEPK